MDILCLCLSLYFSYFVASSEVQILQKEVQNLQQTVYEYKTAISVMVDSLSQMEKRLNYEINDLKEQCRCETGSTAEQYAQKRLLDGAIPNLPVSFHTELTHNLVGLSTNQIVVFDGIRMNNGNSYSSLDGEFVCSVDGIYYFSWTITCSDLTAIETELVLNGNVKSHIFTDAGNHADYETNTGNALLQLHIGDRVWIRVGRKYNGNIIGSTLGASKFLGFLISGNQ